MHKKLIKYKHRVHNIQEKIYFPWNMNQFYNSILKWVQLTFLQLPEVIWRQKKCKVHIENANSLRALVGLEQQILGIIINGLGNEPRTSRPS